MARPGRMTIAWPAAATWVGLALLGGCTQDPGFAGVAGVSEAEQSQVGACAYVMDISMEPGVYGPLASEGLKYAHNKVLASARDAGANTVVFDKVVPGVPVVAVHAVAYRC